MIFLSRLIQPEISVHGYLKVGPLNVFFFFFAWIRPLCVFLSNLPEVNSSKYAVVFELLPSPSGQRTAAPRAVMGRKWQTPLCFSVLLNVKCKRVPRGHGVGGVRTRTFDGNASKKTGVTVTVGCRWSQRKCIKFKIRHRDGCLCGKPYRHFCEAETWHLKDPCWLILTRNIIFLKDIINDLKWSYVYNFFP